MPYNYEKGCLGKVGYASKPKAEKALQKYNRCETNTNIFNNLNANYCKNVDIIGNIYDNPQPLKEV